MTDKTAKGPDVIDQDLTLKNMPDEDMFRNYFGHDFETYRDEVATRVITAAQASSLATQGVKPSSSRDQLPAYPLPKWHDWQHR